MAGFFEKFIHLFKVNCACKRRLLLDGNVATHFNAGQFTALLRTVRNATHLVKRQCRSKEVNL